MREIKFRAWWSHTHNMVQWEQLSREFGMCELDGKTPNLIFMQNTGLKDKGGKEIYEGDIIKFSKLVFEVIFTEGSWELNPRNELDNDFLYNYSSQDIEVIGNIWENPELLKQD